MLLFVLPEPTLTRPVGNGLLGIISMSVLTPGKKYHKKDKHKKTHLTVYESEILLKNDEHGGVYQGAP